MTLSFVSHCLHTWPCRWRGGVLQKLKKTRQTTTEEVAKPPHPACLTLIATHLLCLASRAMPALDAFSFSAICRISVHHLILSWRYTATLISYLHGEPSWAGDKKKKKRKVLETSDMTVGSIFCMVGCMTTGWKCVVNNEEPSWRTRRCVCAAVS